MDLPSRMDKLRMLIPTFVGHFERLCPGNIAHSDLGGMAVRSLRREAILGGRGIREGVFNRKGRIPEG